MGYPLKTEEFGGAFMYTLPGNIVSLGLVTGLDYQDPMFDPHVAFQHVKRHPLFAATLEGGQLIRYGAKALPEGGWYTIPRTYAAGALIAGDAAGFMNSVRLKGIHLAMRTGMLAAETAFEAICKGEWGLPFMSHLIRTWRHGRHILRAERGQALVEFALILPILLLLVLGVIKMGIAATSWSNETHLASEAGRYAAVNSCSACGGVPINTWILTQADTGDLKNPAKTTVTIKFTDAGAKNHCQGDPVEVKLSYTYTLLDLPLLPKFTLPINATSTQRLETNWGNATTGAYDAATDKYTATGASADPC